VTTLCPRGLKHDCVFVPLQEAESLYRQALAAEVSTPAEGTDPPPSTCHVLFSNLAAVYFEMHELERCVEAADHSIALQPSWLKAYYRKALALEGMDSAGPRAVLAVWEAAAQHCEASPLLQKQHMAAKIRWLKKFKQETVVSSEDLLERYSLLTDSRQKLSTMAHFWNASSKSERFQHFNFFLAMIGGAGEMAPLPVAVDMMVDMPLHNYHDLPRAHIEPWCAYFESCASEEKTRLLEQVWGKLSGLEQTAVITDLRLFLGMQMEQHEQDTHTSASRVGK